MGKGRDYSKPNYRDENGVLHDGDTGAIIPEKPTKAGVKDVENFKTGGVTETAGLPDDVIAPEMTLDPFGAIPGEGVLRRRRNVMDALRYGMLSTVRHYMGPMSMRTRGMASKGSYKMPWTASNLGRTNVFVPEMGMPR